MVNASISRAESEFTDMLEFSTPDVLKTELPKETEHQAPEVLVEIEPLVLVNETIESHAASDVIQDNPQYGNPVTQQNTPVEEPLTPVFVEPKPKQTGYVPVAPPSFSMPSPPSNTPEFTVHIRTDKSTD